MYSYKVTDEFKVEVYNSASEIIDNPGPWQSYEEADSWALAFVEALNTGKIIWEDIIAQPEEVTAAEADTTE